MDMTEHQLKEFAKWCLDNGQRKLTKREKEVIKLAIDQEDSLNELIKMVFVSLAIDSNRYVFRKHRNWVQQPRNHINTHRNRIKMV